MCAPKPRPLAPFVFLLALLATPAPSFAQPADVCWLEGRGGPTIPTGELTEFADIGFGLALGGGCPVTRRLALAGTLLGQRLGNPVDLPPNTEGGTRVHELSVLGGVAWSLSGPHSRRISPAVVARAAAGVTLIGVSRIEILLPGLVTRSQLLDGTSFTTEVGLRVGFPLSGKLRAFVDGAWRLIFVDEEDRDTPLGPVEGFGKLSSFPFSVGVEFGL